MIIEIKNKSFWINYQKHLSPKKNWNIIVHKILLSINIYIYIFIFISYSVLKIIAKFLKISYSVLENNLFISMIYLGLNLNTVD